MRGRRRAKIMPPSKGGRHIAMQVAIYARFSSDLQGARSITTRSPWRTQHAAKQGWLIAAEFTDAAISGASMANRPGLEDARHRMKFFRSANVYSGRNVC
jgi:hypothetical protein